MTVIGIYPRKSVYRDNSDSVQVQIRLCKDYAAIIYKGQEIEYRIYDRDEGFSGKNTNRPGFQELMADVRSGLLDVVMVYKLDRISRNVQEFSAMYDIFQKNNVAFLSVKESFDTSTPMGRTVMYILAAFAQLERENTSERVADNMLSLGASGKWTGGRLPAGMTSVRRHSGGREHSYLLVDETSIWRVKALYTLIVNGYPITRIERHCRDNGIRSQNGKYFNASQIHHILTNPVYCQNSIEAYYYFKDMGCSLPDASLFDGKKGLVGYGKTRTGTYGQPRQDMSQWTIAVGIHDPVIPAPDWIAAQKRLGINKMYRTARHKAGLLKGVLRCSCGARMDVRTYCKNDHWFSYYYCSDMARQGRQKCDSGYCRIELIDDPFLRQLQKIRLNPDSFHLHAEKTGAMLSSGSIKADIRKLQAAIDNLTNALTQSIDSPAAGYIVRQIEELDRQKGLLQSALTKALLQESAQQSAPDTRQQIYDNICLLLDSFDKIEYAGKNELIRKIVRKCVFDGESLRIIF